MKISPMQVTLVDHYGSDLMVVNAARVSFSKHHDEFDEVSDTKLIQYLARENHWVPFAHPHATFRIKAPIFVARQLVKHQIGLSWSEESRRYIDSEPEFWFPEVWRGRPEGSIKQGSAGELDLTGSICSDNCIKAEVENMLILYQEMLDHGVAPEQARMVLPLNTMTEWIWSGSLAAWARVCKLRLDPHAQAETRIIATQIADAMSDLFPVSWKALT